MTVTSKVFTAKYSGTCGWSDRAIVAGESEIVLIRGNAYLAEYGDGTEIAQSLIDEYIGMMEADGQHERAEKERSRRENNLESERKFGDPFKTARHVRQQIFYWAED